MIPERALVLELLGPVAAFETAAQALGLEWLGSVEPNLHDATAEDDEDEEGDADDQTDSAPQATIFYLTMPSEHGLRTLLSAWKRFAANQQPNNSDETKLWSIFSYLKELRTWSAQDRLDPTLARYVKALLTSRPDQLVTVEVDLWFRNERQRRDQALEKLRQLTLEFQGVILDYVEIPEIRYQGVLLKLPGNIALQMIEGEGGLARLDDIMRIRPQSAFESEEQEVLQDQPAAIPRPLPSSTKCLAAILDGYPVEQHEALSGRIVIKDVDVSGADVPSSKRVHGTAMASLVIHGDLAGKNMPIDSPVAIIPVLTGETAGAETTPSGKLAIGVIYRALKALVNERQYVSSQLSRVVVVNHSICDTHLPFARASSPWACLIDYFSHYHQLLFIVSSGNINSPIPVQNVGSALQLQQMSADMRDALLISSLRESSGMRGLMCPAETVNGLSVGALHLDDGPPCPPTELDPFQGLEMTSLGSALGLGVNRSVKPDLIVDGGRTALGVSTDAKGVIQVHPTRSTIMGHKVARPGLTGESNRYGLSVGTSDAAALTTRAAVQIATILDDVFKQDGESWSERPTRAVILKSLLVHSARWGDVGKMLYGLIKDPIETTHRQAEKNETTRYIGFGKPDPEHILDGTHNRITILADDVIKPESRHIFRLPIPTHMLRTRDVRTITLTLAWTSPIVTTSTDYRGVALKLVDTNGKQLFWKGVKRQEVDQPVLTTMERGTVVHIQLRGETLWQYGRASGAELEVGVQAATRHSSTKDAEVPYALSITLEVAQSVDTKIYQEIREHLQARVQQRSRTRV